MCEACKRRRRPPQRCARCEKVARRAASDDHGQALCGACRSRSFIGAVHRCTLSGINRTYRTRRPVCTRCAKRPSTGCATCGLPAPVPSAGVAACCARCTLAPPEPCTTCSEPTAGSDREGRARCDTCYRRPVGACGRCGRVRAIVRLATGDDPDLCAVCWTGPTLACEGCGRVRPCRGERRGRMLCSICRPSAPQRCAHCQRQRRVTAHWPEGPICATCYRRALNAKDTCPSCAQTRRLLIYPGFPDPVCSDCAGAPAAHVCGRCGDEHAPYHRGLCARWVLHGRLTDLLRDPAQRTRVGLDGLFDALHGARSPKAAITWLANTATGALPPRDPALARLERWIETFLTDHDSEPTLRPFAHWIVLRRARATSHNAPLNSGHLSSAKTELKAAAAFPMPAPTATGHDPSCAGPSPASSCPASTSRPGSAPDARKRSTTMTPRSSLTACCTHPTSRSATASPRCSSSCSPNPSPASHASPSTTSRSTQTPSRSASARPRSTCQNRSPAISATSSPPAAQAPPPRSTNPAGYFKARRPAVPSASSRSADASSSSASTAPPHAAAPCCTLLHLASEIPAAIVAEMLGIHIHTATNRAEIAGRPWGDYPLLREQHEPR